jgi:glycerophosphoryl diester phosphodiesterase
LIIGHRGAAALAPENTIAAIDAAAEAGADAVELDVRRRGSSLVLAHGAVTAESTPFGVALERVRDLGLRVQLDVKEEGLAAEILAALREAGLERRAFVSSAALQILRSFDPVLPRAYTYPEDRLELSSRALIRPFLPPALAVLRALLPYRLPRKLRAAGASIATLNADVAGPRVIAACHRAGVAVYVWTVNDPARARALVAAGADAIITDDPRILVGGTTTS